MTAFPSLTKVAEAILKTEGRPADEAGGRNAGPAVTIALSRQVGTPGHEVADVLGQQLKWPVYDHQILERLAEEMRVSVRQLEEADEKPGNWLAEWAEVLSGAPSVNELVYARRLRKLLTSIAEMGPCVIVGRGAAHLLPVASTLRVRFVAPLRDRVAAVARDRGLDADAAERYVEEAGANREQFIRDHFHVDTADPANYDLVLNTSRFSTDQCVEQITAGLRAFQASR